MESHLKSISVLILSLFLFGQAKAEVAPRFAKQNVEFISKNFKKVLLLDVADNPQRHAYGMMNRTRIAPDEGMIFVFTDEDIRNFWMKDTLVDLDIAYITKENKVIDIQTMKATSVLQTNLPVYPSKEPAMYAVEMRAGWFKKNKFAVGGTIKLLPGPTSKKEK